MFVYCEKQRANVNTLRGQNSMILLLNLSLHTVQSDCKISKVKSPKRNTILLQFLHYFKARAHGVVLYVTVRRVVHSTNSKHFVMKAAELAESRI
jgi:hypothetical protein